MLPLRSISAAARTAYEDPLVLRTADPMLASDEDLRVVRWNKAAQDLLGFTEEEVLGTPCCELIGCREGPAPLRYRCGCLQLLDRAQPEFPPPYEREVRRKTGERIWVNVTTIVTVSQAGLSVLVHLLHDLSRQHQLEELLRRVASGAARLAVEPPDAVGGVDGAESGVITPRERQVIRLLATGASTEAIAASLCISHRTTRNHIQNILSKLGVHSRLEAVAYASTRGLL